ncbi:MAG: hypothetical protein D8M26_13620 [Ignavibacteriae bacterium]|nr:hypothetical protein [Ignavibacteriota bacterium]MCE7855114.1 hypothetical protein [Ignavibacteria bacterium CHB3]
MIYMWQENRGEQYYRFQTNNRAIAERMKRRIKFHLTACGINCEIWIYQAIFSRPDIARKALKTLAGNTVKFDKKEDIFYASISMSENKNKAA